MRLRLLGRTEPPASAAPSTFELPDFTWTDWPSDESLEPPEPPSGPRRPRRGGPHRRRRLVALAVLALVVGLGGAGIALIVSGGGDGLSKRDRSQLEAAAPGSSKEGRNASLAVPAVVRRSASALPLPRAVAQLFVVGTSAQYPRDPF